VDARGKRESVFQGNVQNAGPGLLPYRGVLHIPDSVHRSPPLRDYSNESYPCVFSRNWGSFSARFVILLFALC